MIAAVIFPRRDNYLAAIEEALAYRHDNQATLYTNGERLAWLPRALPGWLKASATLKSTTPPEAA